MNQRNTQQIPTNSPDVSLVAQKKPPPESLTQSIGAVQKPARPTAPKSIAPVDDEKVKEKQRIEREKKKSAIQKVGTKVMYHNETIIICNVLHFLSITFLFLLFSNCFVIFLTIHFN